MSVFNGERYLRQALDSILRQTYADLELIVVDDGSSDGTAAILDSYGDRRMRVLRNPRNIGLAASLNRGIGAATGEFIARQDADDISEPERIATQVAYLDAHAEVALVGSAHIEIDADDGVIGEVDAHCDHIAIVWAMLFFCPFAHTAVMWRREPVLQAVGTYDTSYRYSMDFEYWTRIAARFRVANLPGHLVRLRSHGQSMTATYGPHTGEGPRLRSTAVAGLLRLRDLHPGSPEAAHGLLSALVFGPPATYDEPQLVAGVSTLFELQRAFANHWRLTSAENAAHLRDLRVHVSETLLAFAREKASTDVDAGAVRRLVGAAIRVLPQQMLRPGRAIAAARLVLSAYRAAWVRRWRVSGRWPRRESGNE